MSLERSARRCLSLLVTGQLVRVADAVAALSHQGALLLVQLDLIRVLDKGSVEPKVLAMKISQTD